MSSPPSRSRPWVSVLKYGIGFALLALVLALNWTGKDGAPGIRDLLGRSPDVAVFALSAGVAVGIYALQYLRWYALVRALDLPFTLRNAVRLGMVGTFYNTFLPGAIGGDIVKAISIAKGHPERKAAAVATVVADRLLGLFGLLLFGGLVGGGLWLAGDPNIAGNPKLRTIVLGCAAASAAGAVGYYLIGFLSQARADRVGERLKKWPKGGTFAELWFTMWQYRQRPAAVLTGVGLSAVAHTLMMVWFHLAVRVYPPDNPALLGTFAEHIVIAPIGFIVQAVVPLPGGLGAGEFTFGGLYQLVRPDGGRVVGLTGRLAMRVVEWVIGGGCYVAYLVMKAELPVEEPKAEEQLV